MYKIGDVIGEKYRIDAEIGRGGMGFVYEVTHILINRKCAAKVLHPSLVKDDSIVERFKREAKLTSAIRHKNICDVTDYLTTTDGAYVLVMPLLRGCTLESLLISKNRLSIETLAPIMLDVLMGLKAAHKANVIHRDLKPANIFLSENEDGSETVKILDFGVSKMIGDESPTQLTQTGQILGTLDYMSPEELKQDPLDHRVDIYALGVILYQAFTGRLPFAGEHYLTVFTQISNYTFPPPSDVNMEISESIEDVILKAMARDPGDRYQSAQEMADELLEALYENNQTQVWQVPFKSDTTDAIKIVRELPVDAPVPQGTAPRPPQKQTDINRKMLIGTLVAASIFTAVSLGNLAYFLFF